MLKNKKIKKAHVTYSEQDTQSKKIGPNSIQNDKRFSKATYDPKFLTPGSKITKVKIDKRFSKMLNDPSFKTTSKIDRYGRTVNHQDENKQLNQSYQSKRIKKKSFNSTHKTKGLVLSSRILVSLSILLILALTIVVRAKCLLKQSKEIKIKVKSDNLMFIG